MEKNFERIIMGVPSKEQIVSDLRIPEVEKKYDRLGRPVEKKNINYGRGSKVFGSYTSNSEVKRIRSALYTGD